MITLDTLSSADYESKRFDLLKKVEGIILAPYLDNHTPKIPTIGLGFNMKVNLEPVAKEILGTHWTIELEQQLQAQVNLSYADPATLQANLNGVLRAWRDSHDSQITTSFQFTSEQQVKNALNVIQGGYEQTIDARVAGMTTSDERAVLFSLVYNATGLLGGNLSADINNNLRPEAWWEIRYQSDASGDAGIANRRYVEANRFELYDDPSNVGQTEAESAARMYTNHRDAILTYENSHDPLTAAQQKAEPGIKNIYDELQPAVTALKNAYHISAATQLEEVQIADNSRTALSGDGTAFDSSKNDQDFLIGSSANNTLDGGVADDVLVGLGGNDAIVGGTGSDIAVFRGDCDDYTITHNADGTVWTITDKVAGRDGTDTLTGMEYVQFANEIHRLELGHSICGGGEDLCLVIDTTSSMSDDIAAVKAQAINLIRQIFETGEDAAASRISIVGFKDPGETQVILSFTNQMSLADREAAAIAAINSISVSGGGDIPEGAYSALLVALNGSAGAWREDANVRRIVLFTDAPAKDGSLAAQVNALSQNVVIVHASDAEPAASSGLAAAAGAVPINAGVEIYGVVVGSDASALASVTQITNDNRGLVFQAGAAGDVAGSIADAVTTPYLIAANGTTGNDTLTGTIVGDRIVGLDGNDTINGLDGDDYLVGGTGNDALFGDAGNDRLDGSEGSDTMVGGAGNDTYIVDNVADVVTELANEGTDTIKSYIAWSLQANFENLELLGTNAVSGFGNSRNNVITGNSGSNFESGGGGSDTLYGKDGDDTLVGDTPAGTVSDTGSNRNNAIATALQITAFTLAADANIQNSTIQPHATIAGTGDNTYRFYSLAITKPGVSAVFDIDFPPGLSNGSFDSHLRLYNSAGVLLAESDDASTSLGGGGSTSNLDSYLQYTFAAAGTYYVELARHSHEVIPAAVNYQLQVSISDISGVTGSLVVAVGASDILDGGSGHDVLTGGGGDDRFVFSPGYGADTITDFTAGAKTDDKIDLTAFHTTLASALGKATQSGADTVFNFGNGDTLTLQNVNKASLNADDFVGAPNKTPGDFGGDAKSDLLFINNTSHGIAEWQMDGAQLLTGPQIGTINAAGGWRFNNTGDFDGDGRNDLMFFNDVTHGVAVWTMDGTRVTASPQIGTINAAGGWGYTGTGDLNGDGKTDLLFLNSTTHGVAIWQLDGTKVTAAPQIGTINAAGGWSYTGIGDFNGDGKTDLLFLNPTTHGVAIWQMDGTKITAAPQIGTINAAGGWSYTGSGDFNGDGKTDLLFLNATTRGVAIWQLNGTQITASSQVGTSAAGWHFQDTGDFDGDGKADLLWINDSTHDATVWLMNGNQIATNRSIGTINAAAGWHYDGLRDFNGDAKTDLLFENSTTHGLAVWLMNGTQVTANSQIGVVNAAADWHLTL
ncbi:FG-GAP-like repeat-containing protein [Bradyrhizobium sp. 930_D9_N1_4]|uniref:FG-GAP-like repeat-containing protein n=1 Tax=Bradyrhizobium sp. 930_D9_N1_4 TaxID=3240374 RepID=UPI003F89CBE0